jgi:hypothetical protein
MTYSSDLHAEKLSFPKTTTDDGIVIEFKSLPENPDSAIPSNLETLSNAITDRRIAIEEYHLGGEATHRRPLGAESEQTSSTSPTSTAF